MPREGRSCSLLRSSPGLLRKYTKTDRLPHAGEKSSRRAKKQRFSSSVGAFMESPKDRSGKILHVGSRVRLLRLSGKWFDDLSQDEKSDVLSMIGEVFEVEEIDEW